MNRDKIKTQYEILRAIKEDKTNHITATDIKQKIGSSMKHIIEMIAELEDKGMIKKTNNQDKRVRLLEITPKAEAFLEGLKGYWQKS